MSEYDPRSRAIEACRLLNDFVLDLVVGTRFFEPFEAPQVQQRMTDAWRVGLTRLAVFHLIITLSKWSEFYDHYRAIIPEDVRQAAKALRGEIARRGIPEIRNKIVGHIWDSDSRTPLIGTEIDRRLRHAYGDSYEGFLRWINSENANTFPATVVSVTERVKGRIIEEFRLSAKEIHPPELDAS